MEKCAICGKKINRLVPDFDLNSETGKISMNFICEECSHKRYEKLKEIFNGNGKSFNIYK